MKTTQPDGFFRIEIDEISTLNWKGIHLIRKSPEVFIRGLPWEGTVAFRDNINVELTCGLNQSTPPWSLHLHATFTLIHPESEKNLTVEGSYQLNNVNYENKVVQMMFRNSTDLKDDLKEFIKDDKITVEIRFWISNMEGIRLVPFLDFTDPNEPLHDIAFLMDGGKIYANKAILALHSPLFKAMFYGDLSEKNNTKFELNDVIRVFKAMFYGDLAEKNKTEIELNDVIREEFIELLHMIYHSHRKIKAGSGESLLKLCDRFKIEETFIDRIETFLMTDIHQFSNLDTYRLAEQYRLSNLKEKWLLRMIECKDQMRDLPDEIKTVIRNREEAIVKERRRIRQLVRQCSNDDVDFE